jgi:hypothetical protein
MVDGGAIGEAAPPRAAGTSSVLRRLQAIVQKAASRRARTSTARK